MKLFFCLIFVFFVLFLFEFNLLVLSSSLLPLPFIRPLVLNPVNPVCGHDVAIAQNLLIRSIYVSINITLNGCFDLYSSQAVTEFQQGNNLNVPVLGLFDLEFTAPLLISLHLYDKYSDDGLFPENILYKVHVQVYEDRTIETIAQLSIALTPQLKPSLFYYYIVRTQGVITNNPIQRLNQLTSDGETPTGLVTFDLNSPESDPVSFGPYPINRAVFGLKGNAAIHYINNTDNTYNPFLSAIRSGILQHTGEWPNWNPSMPMPNSHGCIHAHPQAINTIYKLLNMSGVIMHKNPDGIWPYPYKTQGLLSVEVIQSPAQERKQAEFRKSFQLQQETQLLAFD